MVLFCIRNICKYDIALINVLRHEKNWSSQRLLRKFSGKNWTRTNVDRLLKKINSTGVTERPKGSNRPRSDRTSEFRRTSNLWRSSSTVMKVLCTSTKIRTKLEGRYTFHCRLFGVLQSMIFGWKSTSACQGYCDSIDGAIVFSIVVSNKLRGNVKNEITFIRAKFGADVVNTSKVTSSKTKQPRFLAHLAYRHKL